MKTLLILRHAKSSWSDADLSDHDRPLNGRGKRDAPRIGELIRRQGLTPDLIISSTAKRAFKTAAKVAKACGYEKRGIQQSDDFYLARPSVYLDALHSLRDEVNRVMVVGHNPGLEELLEHLTGSEESLPTAALAEVSLDINTWQELSHDTHGTLANFWRPRELE